MRDFKGMKRQRGRNRGGSTGGKPQQHNANRAFDSNGPEGIKVRGAAQSVFEKYQQLARDATSGGDRVLAENYLQHAEHYFRTLRAMQPQRPVSDFIGRDNFSNFDIDFEAEPEDAPAIEAGNSQPEGEGGEAQREDRGAYPQNGQNGQNGQRREFRDDRPREDRYQNDRPREDRFRDRDDRPRWQDRPRDDRPRDDRPREDRPRDDRPRDDRPREDRYQNDRPREDRPRDERPRDERPRDDRPRDDRPRDDKPRDDRPRDDKTRDDKARDDRSREDRFREREERRRERLERQEAVAADPLAVIEPRGETSEERGPAFRSRDGDVSEAPAFMRRQTRIEPEAAPVAPAPEPAASEEAAPKVRRRRVKAVEE
ncbi:MAG: hypothetical protein JWM33_840 [Caulobacteraceae bacterium]|nr:hypothetical protein [Caulobacteraceae bacterium]